VITSILASIICDEYEREYHRNHALNFNKYNGMKVKFSLSPDYKGEVEYSTIVFGPFHCDWLYRLWEKRLIKKGRKPLKG
jgi:hypothetical protein